MQIEVISKQELMTFKEELFRELRDIFSTVPDRPKEWLRSPEVRKMLGVSSGTLQNLRVNGNLPHTKVGGTFYYKHEDVLQMLESNHRK